ncbi:MULTISPECIES: hybrid sensor histidine kinase/response regulator [unclassified Mucilaginibacter]|uniref:hybrid sensor histidine kinase/response regulator n=1 Tax=unclassified Mucilaginibacter TaxID=2617802 RepID=UPI0031F6F420
MYIDDEQDNLVGFKASLRMSYQVFTTVDVKLAAGILDKNPDIRVIFCDQRMPGMTGVEFFESIRPTHPHPIRILLTAYTDVDSIINAINKGNIFRYLNKPWNEADLLSAIEEANKFYLASSMLSVKNEELNTAYNELNKFAYSVSHDIRGPIAGLLGAINVVREIDSIDEMKEMLVLMEKSLKKLDTYIVSMHDYYAIQRGELKLKDVDFKLLVEELQAFYNVISTLDNIDFKVTVNQSEPFRSDDRPLKLILNNLLSNAFKYQDKNKTEKAVNLHIEVKKGVATITIMDTGIGILGNHIGEIFNLFYRATAQGSGSGFGLYNAKSALLKLNGHIEVNSIMDKGTTFKVVIPSI